MAAAGMTIRPVEGDDPAYAENVIGAVRDAMLLPVPATLQSDLSRLPQSYRGAGGEFWVVEIQGAIVGTIGARPAKGTTWELACLYLLPTWQGMGIGRCLCEMACVFAQEMGATAMEVTVEPGCGTAFELFSSMGFAAESGVAELGESPLKLTRTAQAG